MSTSSRQALTASRTVWNTEGGAETESIASCPGAEWLMHVNTPQPLFLGPVRFDVAEPCTRRDAAARAAHAARSAAWNEMWQEAERLWLEKAGIDAAALDPADPVVCRLLELAAENARLRFRLATPAAVSGKQKVDSMGAELSRKSVVLAVVGAHLVLGTGRIADTVERLNEGIPTAYASRRLTTDHVRRCLDAYLKPYFRQMISADADVFLDAVAVRALGCGLLAEHAFAEITRRAAAEPLPSRRNRLDETTGRLIDSGELLTILGADVYATLSARKQGAQAILICHTMGVLKARQRKLAKHTEKTVMRLTA